MQVRATRILAVVISTVTFVAWGCGSGLKTPPMGKVEGKITYKGNPIPKGTVTFFPVEGKGNEAGQPAIGEIQPNGSFELTTYDTGDGAVLGQHKAIVVARSEAVEKIPEGTIPSQLPQDLKKQQGPKPLVPEKYMDPEKTPLRYTVRAGANDFAIELKD